jgi:hypothetical protein
MGKAEKVGQAPDGDNHAKLCEAVVEAHYLGLSLRTLAADPKFRFAEITAAVSEPLIGWAKFVDARLQAGERPFDKPPAASRRKERDKF